MDFPVKTIIDYSEKKYEVASAMIKYSLKIEESPELMLEYEEKNRDRRLWIVTTEVLSGKIKYHFKNE